MGRLGAPVTNEQSSGSGYRQARIRGGLALIGLAIVLMLIDAATPDFTVDSIQLGLVLGTALALLGVEAGRKLLNGGG